MDNCITLYHGSKNGITGNIVPQSRERCDFGKGFYMGSERTQPLTLICNFPKAKLYELEVNLTGLKIFELPIGLDWALLVAYHRGKMESAKGTGLYHKYESMTRGYDMVVGAIANDRMFVVLDRFFAGDISDEALIHSLSALELGKQYVALTDRACRQIRIINEVELGVEEQKYYKQLSGENRNKGIALANDICRKYRRAGKFFDEIIGRAL